MTENVKQAVQRLNPLERLELANTFEAWAKEIRADAQKAVKPSNPFDPKWLLKRRGIEN